MKTPINTTEAAKRLGVTPRRVRAMAEAGIIKAERFGRDLLFSESEVARVAKLERPTGRPKNPR